MRPGGPADAIDARPRPPSFSDGLHLLHLSSSFGRCGAGRHREVLSICGVASMALGWCSHFLKTQDPAERMAALQAAAAAAARRVRRTHSKSNKGARKDEDLPDGRTSRGRPGGRGQPAAIHAVPLTAQGD